MTWDRTVGIFVCTLVWALPTALFASLAAWGAYAYDKQTVHRWKDTVHTSTKHVSIVVGSYHHGTPSIIVISLLLGVLLALLSIVAGACAVALWES